MQTMNVSVIPDKTAGVIKFSQCDVGRAVDVYLTDEGGVYTIPKGATLTFHGTKPSGLGFTVSTTNEGTYTTIISTAEMTDEAGRFPVELVITNGDTVIGTANFTMWVERSPHPEGTTDGQAEVIVPVLTALIERAETAAESAIDSAAEAKRQADRAFSGTPEGYDALVQSVTDEFNIYGAKNFLRNNNIRKQTAAGVTWTGQDDYTSVSVVGTLTSGNSYLNYGFTKELPAGRYTLSGGDSLSGNTRRISIVVSKNGYYGSGDNVVAADTGAGVSFTLTEPTVLYCRIYIYLAAGAEYNDVIQPMLRVASISDSVFVPYAMTNAEITHRFLGIVPPAYHTTSGAGESVDTIPERFYMANAAYVSDLPSTSGNFFVWNFAYQTNDDGSVKTGMQIATLYSNASAPWYRRQCSNSTWGDWTTMFTPS